MIVGAFNKEKALVGTFSWHCEKVSSSYIITCLVSAASEVNNPSCLCVWGHVAHLGLV